MSLDPATVRRIAKLARIRVEEDQLSQLQAELNGILGWIEQLNEVDVEGVEPLPGGGSKVLVKMTLTAPGCGMGTVIASDAQQKLLYLPGVAEAAVEIVWDPPWHQSMITADGRKILGLE